MSEETLMEFENHLFGIKGNKEGLFKIPKTYYTLTSERLRVNKQGVVAQTRSDIELFKVKDLTVRQKFKDKMMDIGDIEVISADESDPTMVLRRIKSPHDVREKIREASKKAKEVAGVTYKYDL